MENRQKSYWIVGAVIIIACAYFLPNIVLKIDDRNLQSKRESFSLRDTKMDSSRVSEEKRLVDFRDLINGNMIVQNDEPEDTENFEIVMAKIDEFLKLLTYNNRSIRTYSATFLVIANENQATDELFYPIWKFDVIDDEGYAYTFWFDETFGKVMAFYVEASYIFNEKNASEQFLKSFEKYEDKSTTYLRFIKDEMIRQMIEIPYVQQNGKFYFNMMHF